MKEGGIRNATIWNELNLESLKEKVRKFRRTPDWNGDCLCIPRMLYQYMPGGH